MASDCNTRIPNPGILDGFPNPKFQYGAVLWLMIAISGSRDPERILNPESWDWKMVAGLQSPGMAAIVNGSQSFTCTTHLRVHKQYEPHLHLPSQPSLFANPRQMDRWFGLDTTKGESSRTAKCSGCTTNVDTLSEIDRTTQILRKTKERMGWWYHRLDRRDWECTATARDRWSCSKLVSFRGLRPSAIKTEWQQQRQRDLLNALIGHIGYKTFYAKVCTNQQLAAAGNAN